MDSDGSPILRWRESFDNFELALRYIVNSLDEDTQDLIESVRGSLESEDLGIDYDIDDVQYLYDRSDSIVIFRDDQEESFAFKGIQMPKVKFHLISNVDVSKEKISVEWLPENY